MKPFSLLIKPAGADCNLRCTYCFYRCTGSLYPGPGAHRMSTPTLETLVRGYLATPQPQYAFGWQGGEPTLMGLDFFKQVTRLQKQFGRPGNVVANSLQTNATLMTDAWADHLAEYRFLLGVSLDGPAPIHNQYRVHETGGGSHADGMKGLERLTRAKVAFNILTLVSPSNVGHAKELYRYLTGHGFLHHQYIPCVACDDAGRRRPYAIEGEQWGRFLCELFDAWIRSDSRRVSVRLFDSVLAALVDGRKTMCSMDNDCRQYFVVEHNGDIYPCDFFVEERLKIGNIADTSWETAWGSARYREFGSRKRRWNPACETCEFLELCSGDCPKHRPATGGQPDTLSVLCSGWKMFFRHTLGEFKKIAQAILAERRLAEGNSGDDRRVAGRNDPCPCGSGLKSKKCCLRER